MIRHCRRGVSVRGSRRQGSGRKQPEKEARNAFVSRKQRRKACGRREVVRRPAQSACVFPNRIKKTLVLTVTRVLCVSVDCTALSEKERPVVMKQPQVRADEKQGTLRAVVQIINDRWSTREKFKNERSLRLAQRVLRDHWQKNYTWLCSLPGAPSSSAHGTWWQAEVGRFGGARGS